MSVGKYSPTVSRWYADDQKWWEKNGGGYGNGIDPDSDHDDEGYDSYGYGGDCGDGPDRAGNDEYQYMKGEWYHLGEEDEEYTYPLYDSVAIDWWFGSQKYKNQN
jgi:hypothetical protein